MKSLIARTRELVRSAVCRWPSMVDGALRTDIELFSRGGLAILDAIEASGYNTLEHRPVAHEIDEITAARRGARLAGSLRGRRPKISAASLPKRVTRICRSFGGCEQIRRARRAGRRAIVAASYAECNRIARAARSSFYLAFFGLRKEKRNALCALYAFMRLVDNVSDEPGDVDSKRRGLARWRALLDEAVAGRTEGHAILPALADTIARFEIPTRYFHDLILGAEMDLTVGSYATFDRLSEYCYRVAGTVGLTCLHVFGFRDPRAPDLAERLGLAFQLTNIIRDVRTDFEMGRVYLPQEDLDRFGCSATESARTADAAARELLDS